LHLGDRPLKESAAVVFGTSLLVRLTLAAIFLGSCDNLNALAAIPVVAAHRYLYLPYFPIIENILGSSALLVTRIHFLPVALVPKLVPCLADSLISVWFLRDKRFDEKFRSTAAWIYVFCPLPLILICIQGQWDSMWVLPMVSALAMSELVKHETTTKRSTLLLIGALIGVAVLSKPVALIVAGLVLPNYRSRRSTNDWVQECCIIIIGATATLGVFFLKFVGDGINLHQNIQNVIAYAGTPGFTVFGPAKLWFFKELSAIPVGRSAQLRELAVNADLRDLSIIYVVAIVIYQLVAKAQPDRMAAAAAALLICPAVGGLAPQYLFWPLVFILASGRMRTAITYALAASTVYFVFFLIPGASAVPGESLAAYLPLRSLHFLGVPGSALHWFVASPAALDIWQPLANLMVPVAMCALGLFLLLSEWEPNHDVGYASLPPLQLRSTKTCIPYVVVLLVATVAYSLSKVADPTALITAINGGVNRYALTKNLFTYDTWSTTYYWAARPPYSSVQSGSWWGTILWIGPLAMAAWGIHAYRSQRTLDLPERLRAPAAKQ
jgi:hypothetical protein